MSRNNLIQNYENFNYRRCRFWWKRISKRTIKKENIEQVLPDEFDQAKIGKMINNIVLNRHANKDRKELLEIVDKFEEKGLKNVILACTDLQLLIPHHPRLVIYDTMKIFADATIQEILKV